MNLVDLRVKNREVPDQVRDEVRHPAQVPPAIVSGRGWAYNRIKAIGAGPC